MQKSTLNEFVATKIMGWEVDTSSTIAVWVDANGEYIMNVSHWNPTKNANDAFRVLRRMEELGFDWRIEIGLVSFQKIRPWIWTQSIDPNTLIAVNEAALEAVGS